MDTDSQAPSLRPSEASRTRWSVHRVARLGFLVGQGWTARSVADDPSIAASIGNVHRQVRRFGLAFHEALPLQLPSETLDRLEAAAVQRRLSREGLIRNLLVAAGSRTGLIDSILKETRR
jgi:hypothetical protein